MHNGMETVQFRIMKHNHAERIIIHWKQKSYALCKKRSREGKTNNLKFLNINYICFHGRSILRFQTWILLVWAQCNCICKLVLITLKMAARVAETWRWLLSNKIILINPSVFFCFFTSFIHLIKARNMEQINLSKSTVYVVHQQFNIQQLYALPTLYLRVLYISQNKQRLVQLTA